MVGITRIKIESNWSDWRTKMSDDLAPVANELYRVEFANLNMPLMEGEEIITCTKSEAMARYDWREGIDVILRFSGGAKATLQEKYLTYHESTATFEERKTSGAEGAWYYCTAQYYFVGYARKYLDKNILKFQDGMMVDFPAIKRADMQERIDWKFNGNGRDGRRATFRYINFDDVPQDCRIWRMWID